MSGAGPGEVGQRAGRRQRGGGAGQVASNLLECPDGDVAHLGLLPIEVELVLGDGRLPNALGEALGLAEPHVDVDGPRVERTTRHRHLQGHISNLKLSLF